MSSTVHPLVNNGNVCTLTSETNLRSTFSTIPAGEQERSSQPPGAQEMILANNLLLGTHPRRAGLCNGILGRITNNFRPHHARRSFPAAEPNSIYRGSVSPTHKTWERLHHASPALEQNLEIDSIQTASAVRVVQVMTISSTTVSGRSSGPRDGAASTEPTLPHRRCP